MDLRLIENKTELKGTCYFEFLPGPYKGHSWNDNSVFMDEETFTLIEPVFQRRLSDFDHFAFVGVSKSEWHGILIDLKELNRKLSNVRGVGEVEPGLGFLFKQTEATFDEDFSKNVANFAQMIDQFCTWINSRLVEFDMVSILGM